MNTSHPRTRGLVAAAVLLALAFGVVTAFAVARPRVKPALPHVLVAVVDPDPIGRADPKSYDPLRDPNLGAGAGSGSSSSSGGGSPAGLIVGIVVVVVICAAVASRRSR